MAWEAVSAGGGFPIAFELPIAVRPAGRSIDLDRPTIDGHAALRVRYTREGDFYEQRRCGSPALNAAKLRCDNLGAGNFQLPFAHVFSDVGSEVVESPALNLEARLRVAARIDLQQ